MARQLDVNMMLFSNSQSLKLDITFEIMSGYTSGARRKHNQYLYGMARLGQLKVSVVLIYHTDDLGTALFKLGHFLELIRETGFTDLISHLDLHKQCVIIGKKLKNKPKWI